MKYTLILISLFLCSCGAKPKGESIIEKEGYNIKTIDSCEYIEVEYMSGYEAGYYSLTHKGNCKYCAMRNKN